MSNVLSTIDDANHDRPPHFKIHGVEVKPGARSIAATLHASESGIVRGASIADLTSGEPALLLFLPDLTSVGGTQTASELSRVLLARSEQSILVHRHDDSVAEPILIRHGLGNLRRLPDPTLRVHAIFGIEADNDPEPISLLSVLAPLCGAIRLQGETMVRLQN